AAEPSAGTAASRLRRVNRELITDRYTGVSAGWKLCRTRDSGYDSVSGALSFSGHHRFAERNETFSAAFAGVQRGSRRVLRGGRRLPEIFILGCLSHLHWSDYLLNASARSNLPRHEEPVVAILIISVHAAHPAEAE